jgi:hypothetical protein
MKQSNNNYLFLSPHDAGRATVRQSCRTCELLKEFYRLKLDQFLYAARSPSAWHRHGHLVREDEAHVLKQESLDALTALMRHAKICYGLENELAGEEAA